MNIQPTTFEVRQFGFNQTLYSRYLECEEYLRQHHTCLDVTLSTNNIKYGSNEWISSEYVADYITFNNPQDAVLFKLKFGDIIL